MGVLGPLYTADGGDELHFEAAYANPLKRVRNSTPRQNQTFIRPSAPVRVLSMSPNTSSAAFRTLVGRDRVCLVCPVWHGDSAFVLLSARNIVLDDILPV